MMRPQFLLFLAIALASCTRTPPPMPDIFTETAGPYHRTAAADLQPVAAPDPVPQAVIERLRTATYEGPGKLEARAYQFTTSAVALDVVQRWRPSPDTIFFYHDRFFVVVTWHSADRKALQEFVSALEKKLNANP